MPPRLKYYLIMSELRVVTDRHTRHRQHK